MNFLAGDPSTGDSCAPALPIIGLCFFLPLLDERVAGTEQLLESLNNKPTLSIASNIPVRGFAINARRSDFCARKTDALMFRLHGSSLQDRSETPFNLLALPEIPAPASQDSVILLELMMRATSGTTTTISLRSNQKEIRFIQIEDGGRLLGVQRRTASL